MCYYRDYFICFLLGYYSFFSEGLKTNSDSGSTISETVHPFARPSYQVCQTASTSLALHSVGNSEANFLQSLYVCMCTCVCKSVQVFTCTCLRPRVCVRWRLRQGVCAHVWVWAHVCGCGVSGLACCRDERALAEGRGGGGSTSVLFAEHLGCRTDGHGGVCAGHWRAVIPGEHPGGLQTCMPRLMGGCEMVLYKV